MGALYLVDVVLTETNAVRSVFVDIGGEKRSFLDEEYRPYFLVPQPLIAESKDVIDYFSGQVQMVEKQDLFTREKRNLAMISWPNVKIATKAAKSFRKCWETEIDFTKSYVYDKRLAFGSSHSEDSLKPLLSTSTNMQEKLEKTFEESKIKDPSKYALISYWFHLLNQNIPTLRQDFFGTETNTEKVYSTWLLSRIANLSLYEAYNSKHVSSWLRSIVHTYLRRHGFLIPTSEELARGRTISTVPGALTVSPKAGVYFKTTVCDFESLYASCIDSFNLSYETINCEHTECKTNIIPDFQGHVCTQRRGIYAVIVGALKDLRIRLFKPAIRDKTLNEEERKKASVAAKLLKLILVSSYGVTVRIRGLACPPLAEAITGYGRYVLKESWRIAEKDGLRPLYGDTDSLFLDDASQEQIEGLAKTIKDRFSLDLAIDKRYQLCVLPKAKKAYFGILTDGRPDIKGLTATKSNSPRYINEVFQQCASQLANVKNQEEYAQAKRRIEETVNQSIDRLKRNEIGLDDLVYSVQLYLDPNERTETMTTAHQPYQCAKQLIDAGKKPKKGGIIRFIKVKPFKYKGRAFTVKPVESVGSLAEVNLDDYIRNLLTALDQVFEPMGIKMKPRRGEEISKWLTNQ